MASRPSFGSFLGFSATFDHFRQLGWRVVAGSGPSQVGVKWCLESKKNVGVDGPSGV